MAYVPGVATSSPLFVVAPDERLRTALGRSLVRQGFEVVLVERPEHVPACLGDVEHAVMLFDVQPAWLPSTRAAIGRLRDQLAHVRVACLIPVSMASAFPLGEFTVDAALIKPIDLSELAMELRRLAMDAHRAHREERLASEA